MNRFIFLHLFLPMLLVLAGVVGILYLNHDPVSFDSSARSLMAEDPRNLETFEKVDMLIPGTTMVMAALRIDNLFSNEGAGTVALASEQLMGVDGCEDVKSLTHSGRPVRNGFTLDIKSFMPLRATPAEWQAIRDFTTLFPLSRNTLVSEDARYAVVVGVYRRDLQDHDLRVAFRDEVMAALKPVRERATHVYVLSFPIIEAEGYEAVKQDLVKYAIWATCLILAVLWLSFRSMAGVLYVLCAETVGVLILFSLFQISNSSIDLYKGILFPLVGGLQLTFVIHYLASLQRHARSNPPAEAGAIAVREVLGPSALAALTTMAGLGTLALSGLPMVAAFGRLGVGAVALVFAATFAVPFVTTRWFRMQARPPDAGKVSWGAMPARRRVAIFVIAVVGCGIMAVGALRLRTDIRAVEFIKKGHPIREALELLDRELGGTSIFQVRIDTGRAKGLQSPAVLAYMEDLRRYAYTLEGVTDAYAYSQLYIGLNQIWEGGGTTTGFLPTNPLKLGLFSQLINSSPLLFKDSFVEGDAQTSFVILRSRDMPGADYLAMLENFMARAEKTCPDGVTLKPVNGLHTILAGDRKIVRNQLLSLGTSAVVIGLMMAGLWSSARLAVCVLLTNVPALLAIFGAMGLFGTPMNSITVMVTAVLLGIAVDDGIHLVSHYRHGLRSGLDRETAIALALQAKLKPMACTSAILAVSLGLLLLTSFPPVAYFGIFSALGLAIAFLGVAFLLPALLAAGRGGKRRNVIG